FNTNVKYAEKLTKEKCEAEIVYRHPQFIMQEVYEISATEYRTLDYDFRNPRYGYDLSVRNPELKKLNDFMIKKNTFDYNKCVVEETFIVVKCRKIQYKANHSSDDGVITNDSFKEEREENIKYSKKYEVAEERVRGMSIHRESSTPNRVKTKNQYTLESVSVGNYTESAEQFNRVGPHVYTFIRRSGIDFLEDKVFEINYKYSNEKTVKIYVDDKVVEELNILIDKEVEVDLTDEHYNFKKQITEMKYDKKVFAAKFVAGLDKDGDEEAKLTVRILKDVEKNSDLSIRLKTIKLKDTRKVTFE
ncbi:MAG: hypothetical protein FWE79_01735, partial [Firmicutes bacterium]|nr:hypothetical protein [Bacillota bacterium]